MTLLIAQDRAQTHKPIWHAKRAEETCCPTQDAGERIDLRRKTAMAMATTEKGGKVHRAATQGGRLATTNPDGTDAQCRLPLPGGAPSAATCPAPASSSFFQNLARGPYATAAPTQTFEGIGHRARARDCPVNPGLGCGPLVVLTRKYQSRGDAAIAGREWLMIGQFQFLWAQ